TIVGRTEGGEKPSKPISNVQEASLAAVVLANLGAAYRANGEPGKSRGILESALAIATRDGVRSLRSARLWRVHLAYADLCFDERRFREAADAYAAAQHFLSDSSRQSAANRRNAIEEKRIAALRQAGT